MRAVKPVLLGAIDLTVNLLCGLERTDTERTRCGGVATSKTVML